MGLLPDLAGRDAVELGCGTAYVSSWLARRGARVVGLDNSPAQLRTARALQREFGLAFPLVLGDAERAPLHGGAFDFVVSEYGASIWCDPYRWVPEAARLLRPGGLFAFSTASPIAVLCRDQTSDTLGTRLFNDYFGMARVDWPDMTEFQLPYGEWIALFRRHGLVVEELIETRPPPGARGSYRDEAETEWARHWPMEVIWRTRKAAGAPTR